MLLPGTYIVDKIIKKRKVRGNVELLVSWQVYGTEDNTWEPVHHLPTELVEAFLNPREKEDSRRQKRRQKDTTNGDATSLQDNPRKKRKTVIEFGASSTEEVEDQSNEEQKALQDQLLQEVKKRKRSTLFSSKTRTKKGKFSKKKISDISWRNYVRSFFKQHEGFHMHCCKKPYNNAESFITHQYRHHHE